MPDQVATGDPGRLSRLQGLGMLASLLIAGYALYAHHVQAQSATAWVALGTAFLLAIFAQLGGELPAAYRAPTRLPTTWLRLAVGLALAAGAAVLWYRASAALAQDWEKHFDAAWLSWVGGAAVLGIGLDLASGRWVRPSGPRIRWSLVACALLLLGIAAAFRIGNLLYWPGESHITQIEELQVGNFGWEFARGGRHRWEFLSHSFLAAVGLLLGGQTMTAMRMPFALVSVLKALPLFLWLRLSVGTVGAFVGTTLFAVSFWDAIMARIPSNHPVIIVAIAFALLAGPARSGRPSAYVWLGFLGGFVVFDYVAYRPLVGLVAIGAVAQSFRDPQGSILLRFGRPLVTIALIVAMSYPLYSGRLHGWSGFRDEYLNGWNRAVANYDPQWGPRDVLLTRFRRAVDATSLFFFTGDSNPTHNINGQPLLDPVSATLLLIGVGGAIAHVSDPVLALSFVGLVVTMTGTLVMTGNWDVGRFNSAVAYVYALVGVGAAGVAFSLERAARHIGRQSAVVLLAAAILFGVYWNGNQLVAFVSSPLVRRAEFHALTFISNWIRENARPGERIVGVAPVHPYVLQGHDGSWLLGTTASGASTDRVSVALQDWLAHPQPTLLFLYSPGTARGQARYIEWLVPGVKFQTEKADPTSEYEIAWAHVDRPPADLPARLAASKCSAVRLTFDMIRPDPGAAPLQASATAPFVDAGTWPPETLRILNDERGKYRELVVTVDGSFAVAEPGPYYFTLLAYPAESQMEIDGRAVAVDATKPADLAAGVHQIRIRAKYGLVPDASARLFWQGPDTHGETELLPFYRLAAPDPACEGGRSAGTAADGAHQRNPD